MLSRGRGCSRWLLVVQDLRSLQALSKQVKVLRKLINSFQRGLDEGSSDLKGRKVTSRPCSFLQMDGLPVNRFSGTVLEQLNTAIFEAFWRSPPGSLWWTISILRPDRTASGINTAVPRDAKRLNDEARRLVDAPCSLSRSFRGVPLLLLELRFARRRRWPRRTLRPVLLPLGHLGALFGGQDVHDLRHHFRVSDFHFHLNLGARFSR